MAGLLALIWLAGVFASIFFVFKPNPSFAPYRTRGRSVGMTLAFLIGTPLLGAIVNPQQRDSKVATPAAEASNPARPPDGDGAKAPPDVAPEKSSAWTVSEEKSPLDDSSNVYASVDAQNKVRGWLTSERPSLSVRCKEGKLEAYLDAKSQLTSRLDFDAGQSLAAITYRVGTAPPVKSRVPESSDGRALFFRKPESFIRNLRGADRLVVEYTPFQAGIGVATFAIGGSAEAMKRVLSACGQS